MTAARRQRKSRRRTAVFFVALAGLGLWLPVGIAPLAAATTERVVSDPNSGLAISGFDPVAYFTDAVPKLGLPEFELRFAGVTWRVPQRGQPRGLSGQPRGLHAAVRRL
jgi:hypothetical protein